MDCHVVGCYKCCAISSMFSYHQPIPYPSDTDNDNCRRCWHTNVYIYEHVEWCIHQRLQAIKWKIMNRLRRLNINTVDVEGDVHCVHHFNRIVLRFLEKFPWIRFSFTGYSDEEDSRPTDICLELSEQLFFLHDRHSSSRLRLRFSSNFAESPLPALLGSPKHYGNYWKVNSTAQTEPKVTHIGNRRSPSWWHMSRF